MRGLVERNDVPGEVRAHFEGKGVVFADPVWLIRPNVDPAERKKAGHLVAGLGVVLGGGRSS